jgi:hypothetical protein
MTAFSESLRKTGIIFGAVSSTSGRDGSKANNAKELEVERNRFIKFFF